MTHSYAIKPILSKWKGIIIPFVYLLPERPGKFGSIIKKHTLKAKNIYPIATRSGKMYEVEI